MNEQQINRLKYLLEKYQNKLHSSEEGQELFDMLKQVENPSMFDEIFREGWIHSGQGDYGHLLSWEEINLEINRRSHSRKIKNWNKVLVLRYSGIASSLMVIISLVWWLMPGNQGFEVYRTSFGETSEIFLDDGTQVTLNANSTLIWHLDLKKDKDGKNYRLAELDGEAFFNVAQVASENLTLDSEILAVRDLVPFKVRTPDLIVNVLGTAFNVMTWRGKTDVYLDHGAVELDLYGTADGGGEKNGIEVVEKVVMKPGEMVSFSARTRNLHKLETSGPEGFTEWKDGTLVFENVEFGSMLDRLANIYGKEFEIEDTTLLQLPVNFGVPYENWETVIKLMELTLMVDLIEEPDNKIIVKKREG